MGGLLGGGGGGAKDMLAPLLHYWGRGGADPWPPSSYAYAAMFSSAAMTSIYLMTLLYVLNDVVYVD